MAARFPLPLSMCQCFVYICYINVSALDTLQFAVEAEGNWPGGVWLTCCSLPGQRHSRTARCTQLSGQTSRWSVSTERNDVSTETLKLVSNFLPWVFFELCIFISAILLVCALLVTKMMSCLFSLLTGAVHIKYCITAQRHHI